MNRIAIELLKISGRLEDAGLIESASELAVLAEDIAKDDRLLTVAEAAAWLGCGRRTLDQMISDRRIPAHLIGTIDTQEKFEAKREELANRVWARMEANDSAGCRGCHDVNRMAMDEQALRARREHEEGFAKGETCISCHKGIAHHLPASMLEENAEDVDFDF